MQSIRFRTRGYLATALLALLVVSANINAQQAEEQFSVSVTSQADPTPLNRIHSWLLRIETTGGEPVIGAEVDVDGGMPAHRHGLPTQPVVREVGNGDYLVEGIKFSMTGHWEMWFEIRSDGISEKKMIAIDL